MLSQLANIPGFENDKLLTRILVQSLLVTTFGINKFMCRVVCYSEASECDSTVLTLVG